MLIMVMLATQAIRPWQEAKLAFFEIVIPILLCFAGSVTYHTLMANNQNYQRWLFIDVSLRPKTFPSLTLCISAGLMSRMLPPVHQS